MVYNAFIVPVKTNMQSQNQKLPGKPHSWKLYFILLAIANIVTIVLPLLVLYQAVQRAKQGVSGTEFIGLILAPLLLSGIVIAILNVITISVFLRKKYLRKVTKIFGLVIVILSALYVGGVAIVTFRDIKHNIDFNTAIS